MLKFSLVTMAAALLMAGGPAEAAPIFDFSGGTSQSNLNFTYAFDFTPVQDITVEALGFFDFERDGLAAPHRVGLWTTDGVLLASATVNTANSTLAGAVVNDGQFRYTSILSVDLFAGTTYRLGAAGEGADDVWFGNGINLSGSPYATVSSTGFFAAGNFVFPSQTIGNRYAAGNLLASPTSTIPEPASILLFGVGGLAILAKRRRRKTQQVQ